ncbi:MAG TPA: hypothetical protein VJA23_02115 [Candidatus Nanoarchaeia archaeon]|nr:hypothetical protein [Candidatus Nanoarchaeia archaeon]
MADLTKAKNLLRSAEDLFVRKEFAGVAGLAYQAFEVGIIVLSENLQEILKDHLSRRKKAEELLGIPTQMMKKIWRYRNVDFYGNERIGENKIELSEIEIKEALTTVKDLLIKIENLIQKWKFKPS